LRLKEIFYNKSYITVGYDLLNFANNPDTMIIFIIPKADFLINDGFYKLVHIGNLKQ